MESVYCVIFLLPGFIAAVDTQKEFAEIRNTLKQQESQIMSLCEEYQAVRKDVSRLEMEKQSLKMETRFLRKHVDRIDIENQVLKMEVDRLGLIISHTSDDGTKLTGDKMEYSNEIPGNELRMKEKRMKNDNKKTILELLKAKRLIGTGQVNTSTTTAFYAYMSKNEPNPSAHHQLIFDEVKTNLGNGYHKYTGTFTAPTAGVFVFTYKLYTGNHGAICFDTLVNDAIYDSTYGETNDVSYDYDSDSGTIVVALNQGDNVYLRSYKDCSGTVLSDRDAKSTFAGWKLN